jgi:DNA-directed RNA polymerase subunit alpha
VAVAEPINVREFLREDPAFGSGDVRRLQQVITGPQLQEARQELYALQSEIESAGKPDPQLLVRAGIASYVLGQHRQAIDYLSRVPNEGVALFYHALALAALERHAEAEEKFEQAAKKGYDEIECHLRRAGEVRAQGRLDEAEKLLRSIAQKAASRAEYSYQMGCILSDRGDTYGAIEYFERAVDMQPTHARALFRLAAENALRGNDDDAIQLYERALSRPPLHLGALLNLGLLYEDRENYPAAAFCFRRILDVDPTHDRARLYLRDIEATDDMFYDEERDRLQARMQHLLGRPVTDFELTVRARNCLQGMNIHSLGDLTRITEQDLLAGKNFGETSLKEIRDLMAAHGLQIGQAVFQKAPTDRGYPQATLSPQEQAVLGKPISELNLSVRARKCMSRLGITTVGELVQRTPDELLASRNFGVTSLNEVRSKLAELGISLRND